MAISIREHNYPWQTDYKTYDVVFFNDSILTTVTCEPTRVSDWISEAKLSPLHRSLVGLDVEWRPSNSRERNPVAVLQLCVGGRCLIYQTVHSRYIPQSLATFLSDNLNTFVGVSIKPDLEKLQSDYGIGGNARYVDLRELAANVYNRNDLKNAGLKALAGMVLGREVEKPQAVTMSRWDNRWLTAEQVKYACVDAFLSFEIGRILNASNY